MASGQSVTHIYDSVGSYSPTLTVTSDRGCESSFSQPLEIMPPVEALAWSDTTICEDYSAQLNASGGIYYQWQPNTAMDNDTIPNPVVSPTITTNYTVAVSDDCTSDQADVLVNVLPAPIINAGPDTTIFRAETVELTSNGGGTYLWTPSEGLSDTTISNPDASPWWTTTYFVEVTADNGCSRVDSVTVTIRLRCERMHMPNAFTPNNDGQNDLFRIVELGDDVVENFSIFNRWGEIVFSTNQNSHGWDGTVNGKPQPIGTYLYTITSSCEGQIVKRAGNVTLLR